MMSYADAVGACGPVGCAPSTGQYPYPAYPGYPAYGAPYADPYASAALVGPMSWDIVGQTPAPAPAPVSPGLWDRTKAFGQQETLGIKNQNLALGAAALGLIYYGYTEGWFGGRSRASSDYSRWR